MCNRDCLEINNFRVVWRGRGPSISNPQQRHARCEDELLSSGNMPWLGEANSTPAEQKFFPCAFAARGSQRPENRPVACFQRERAGRPWIPEGTSGKGVRGVSKGGRQSPFRGLCYSPFSGSDHFASVIVR